MDKALETQFNKFTEELKNISKILKVSNGLKLSSKDPEFKTGGIQKDEKARLENVATITANKLAAKLGPMFSSTAQAIVKGLKLCFTDLGVKLVDLSKAIDANGGGMGDYFYDVLGVLHDIKDGLNSNNSGGGVGKSFSVKGLTNLGIAKAISKTLGWQGLKDNIESYHDYANKRLLSIQNYMEELVGVTKTAADPKTKKKKEEGKGIGSILGGIAGLALLGVGIFLIVQALVESAKVNPMEVVKVLLVVGAFVGLFLLVGMAGNRLKNAALGFAILSATVLFLVIPTLHQLGKMDWGLLLNSVLKFGVIALACVGVLKLLSMMSPSDVLKSVAGLALFVAVIGFGVVPLLKSLAAEPWDMIKEGLLKFGVISLVCAGILKLLSMMNASDVLKSVGGLGLFVAIIGLGILPLLKTLVDTKWDLIIEGLLKFGVISLACIGVMKLMSMISTSDVLKSVGGLALFTLVIGFLVLPTLKEITKYPFEEMIKALGFMGLIMIGIGAIIRITGEILTKGGGTTASIAGLVAVLAFTFLMGYLADQLNKFAALDWGKIGSSLALSLVALGIFGAAVVGIGLLVLNPVVAPLLIAGAVAVGGLTLLMGMIADALQKFSTVNGDQIIKVGTGLIALGTGLAAFLVGMVAGTGAGVVSKLSGVFGLDPAAQIKKFESIDAEKIFKLGSGLLFMSLGLKSLSKDIDLKNITEQMTAMITPLALFSSGLILFTEAYKNLDTAIKGSEINKIYQMKLQNDNSIQQALVDLNTKEVELLSSQLEQLKQNGEYLRIIASSGGAGGGTSLISGQNKSQGGVYSANFQTKESYLSHLKLTSAALQS